MTLSKDAELTFQCVNTEKSIRQFRNESINPVLPRVVLARTLLICLNVIGTVIKPCVVRGISLTNDSFRVTNEAWACGNLLFIS